MINQVPPKKPREPVRRIRLIEVGQICLPCTKDYTEKIVQLMCKLTTTCKYGLSIPLVTCEYTPIEGVNVLDTIGMKVACYVGHALVK